MLPVAIDGVFQEWAQFHASRKWITLLKHGGLTTSQAFDQMEYSCDTGNPPIVSKWIVSGLKALYFSEKTTRAIYDPEYEDPAYFAAVNVFLVAMHKPGLFWFICWVMLMRFNRKMNSQVLQMWNAPAGEALDDILNSVSMNSITTRGNEDANQTKDRVRKLHAYFKPKEGEAIAEKSLASLKVGVEFQTVVESFPLPPSLRPYGFKEAEQNFKPYFNGKVLSDVSPQFSHIGIVGGSLIAANKKDAESSFQLYDLCSESINRPDLFRPVADGRNCWAAWAYAHFNMERDKFGLHHVDDGKVEHSGCEYIRYLRECMDQELWEFIPPSTRAWIGALGFNVDAERKAKRMRPAA
jgi:hypothetical protein